MPNRSREVTSYLAQEAFALRHVYGLTTTDIARQIRIDPRTVVRYCRLIESHRVPWPPARYAYAAQWPSRARGRTSLSICPNCGTVTVGVGRGVRPIGQIDLDDL